MLRSLLVPPLASTLPAAVDLPVTVTLGQDYLPGRIGTSSGVTLGLAISTGGLLAPRPPAVPRAGASPAR